MGMRDWFRSPDSPRRGVYRGLIAVGLGLAMVIPAGCASGGPGGSPAARDSGETPTAAGAAPAPTTAPAGEPTQDEENPADMTDPTLPGTPKTLRGTVQDGVEANCMLLAADDGKTYLLVGGDRAVINGGGRVEVTGQIMPDLMTTCQQGIPVTVSTVRPI
jgi:hypothetical protein